jgi:hypothetical protein
MRVRVVMEIEAARATPGAVERLRGFLRALEDSGEQAATGPSADDLEALGFERPRLTRAVVEGEEVNVEAWMEGADLVVLDDRRELALRVEDLGLGSENLEVLADRLLALGRMVYAAGRRAGERAGAELGLSGPSQRGMSR